MFNIIIDGNCLFGRTVVKPVKGQVWRNEKRKFRFNTVDALVAFILSLASVSEKCVVVFLFASSSFYEDSPNVCVIRNARSRRSTVKLYKSNSIDDDSTLSLCARNEVFIFDGLRCRTDFFSSSFIFTWPFLVHLTFWSKLIIPFVQFTHDFTILYRYIWYNNFRISIHITHSIQRFVFF